MAVETLARPRPNVYTRVVIILLPLLLFIVIGGLYGLFRLAGGNRTHGALAWWSAQGAGLAFLVSVMVYQKPASFYTNFVLLPSIGFFLGGLGCVLLTIALAIVAMIKRTAIREALQGVGLALATLGIAVLIIYWRAR